jgi:hypothetical protein
VAGRPTLCTPERITRAEQAAKLGATRAIMAQYIGVSEPTFYRWMSTGRDSGTQPYRELYERVKAAEGECAVQSLALIKKAAMGGKGRPGSWQAAAWLLERRHGYRKDDANLLHQAPNAHLSDEAPLLEVDLTTDDGIERAVAALAEAPADLLRRALNSKKAS